jgi:3-oxoadipate enol-lactonase
MPFADVNDQRIYFEDSGGNAAAVIFSHGFLMDHEMFEPQVRALSGEFRCISWDQRGFGQTDANDDFTFWDSAADALALLSYLAIEKAFFVSMSQGGFLSIRAALTAPDRVLGLGLIDTQAGTESEEMRPAYDAMLNEWTTNGPSDALAGAVAGIIMSPGYDHSHWIAKWQARPRDFILRPYRTLMERDDISDRLADINAPAIVFHGEADVAIPMEKAEQLLAEMGNCEELVRIPGAGHASNLSHPSEVNGPLVTFLRRNEPIGINQHEQGVQHGARHRN